MAAPDHVESVLLRRQSVLRHGQTLPIRGQRQIRLGNRRHQQDLRAPAGLLRGQELLQGLVLEAADAAEKVDFPGGGAEIDLIAFDRHRFREALDIGGYPLLSHAGGHIGRWKEIGSLNAVLGAGQLDILSGHPQIEIVRQGDGYDLLEFFVGEEFPPPRLPRDRSVGRRLDRLIGCASGPAGGDRRHRAGIFGSHRAASRDEGESNQ